MGLTECPDILSYRGDSREPDVIFKEGFQPQGTSTDLYRHASDNYNPPSNFISTTKSPNMAAEYGSQFYTENGYVYAMKTKNGIDVNAVLGKNSPFPKELEIAIPGGVSPKNILGATPVDASGNFVNYSILNPQRYGLK
ncbi:scabin-related ADP-ribosyltransferase [Photorhabdus luminescens]|uniref:scabin-related ADP-ribosyltransferase n=1 Tax=Photorhabdus luminescens TaxID=29488 RepID=UPI00159ED03E